MTELDIPAARDFPRGHHELRARHLVRELTTTRRRRRLMLTLVPAVVVLLTAATGFTAYSLLRTEPSHFDTIGCYERVPADPNDTDREMRGNITVVSSDGRGAIEQCRELWEQGAMGQPVPRELAACVLDTGPIGVFPSAGPGTCERMGLADLSARGQAESKRFVRMRDAIYAQIGTPASGTSRRSGPCVGPAQAESVVRRALDAHGFTEWKIATLPGGGDPPQSCAEVAFDGRAKTAQIFPQWTGNE
jgi:hypothetical protein